MSDSGISRRGFIGKLGKGLAAANVAGGLLKNASAQLMVPDPPGKKLGWAVVGLGSLAINQILPAFAKCEKSKVVALVSGHPDKANKLALRYGVDPKNIYNYENYDSIKDNPDVDVIYIVLPNGMHAEYTIRGFQAGKHVLMREADGQHSRRMPADDRRRTRRPAQADDRLPLPIRALSTRSHPHRPLQGIRAHADDSADAGFNIGDPNQWRLNKQLAGGGSLMDIGIYALNASRYLTGEEPTEVNAMIYTTPDDRASKKWKRTSFSSCVFPAESWRTVPPVTDTFIRATSA